MRDDETYEENNIVRLLRHSGGADLGSKGRKSPPVVKPQDRIAWCEEREALLRQHHGEGLSCSQIAKRLGGVTRNAVIGKLNRMGLSTGYVVTHRKVTGKMAAARRKRPSLAFGQQRSLVPIPTEPIPPPHETDIPRVSFMDLEETQCKFICTPHPLGPYEKQFCGEPRVDGLPYCVPHSQRCYGNHDTYKPARPRKGHILMNAVGFMRTELETA